MAVEAAFLNEPAAQDPFDCLAAHQSRIFKSYIVGTGNVFDVAQVYFAAGCGSRSSAVALGSLMKQLLVAAEFLSWCRLLRGRSPLPIVPGSWALLGRCSGRGSAVLGAGGGTLGGVPAGQVCTGSVRGWRTLACS